MQKALKARENDLVLAKPGHKRGKLAKMAVGLGVGAAVTLVLLCGCSLLLSVSDLPDGLIPVLAFFSVAFGALAAGIVAVAKLKSGGLVNGALTGVCFFLLQLVVSLVLGDGNLFTWAVPLYFLVDVVLSAAGGIVSVNLLR